jgi:hypothetical protein
VLSNSSFSDNPSLDVTLGYDHAIVGTPTRGLELNYFWTHNYPQDSTCPLMKPWFELWPTLNILNSSQLLFPQCYGIVDLTILTITSKSTVHICPSNLWTISVPPSINNSISLHNSRLQEFEISNPTSFVLQSPRVHDLLTHVLLDQQFFSTMDV